MRTPGLIAILLATALAAQADPGKDQKRRARSLVNRLELPQTRVAAVEELLALGVDAVPALAEKLKDPRADVVKVVCRMLCMLGPRAQPAMPHILTAVGSPDPVIAQMARMTELAVQPTGGMVLCEYGNKRIVEIDADGTERTLLEGEQAWDVEALPGGHLLVTHYQQGKVVEYDAKGAKVWSFAELKMPLEADRLLDGNTLIADTQGQRVVEIDRSGKIVWEYKSPNASPYDVERLANGRTLITIYPDRVIEVDAKGEVVWQLRDLKGVFDADRLLNGNTLLTLYQSGSIQEVDRDGKVVWEVKDLEQPNEADRLPSGNTLVATPTSVIELAPDGSTVRTVERGQRVSEVARR